MTFSKQIVIVAIVAAVGAGAYYSWPPAKTDPASSRPATKIPRQPGVVETSAATLQRIGRVIEAVGTTRAARSVEIAPLSAGRVVESRLSQGAEVKSRSLLLALDSVIEKADVLEAKARLEEASRALQRSDSLTQSSGMSQAAIDNLKAQAKIARAQLERANKRLEDRFLRAPFSGFISLSDIETGSRVKAGEVVAVLDDLSGVLVEFSIPEDHFGSLQAGDNLTARAAAFPGRNFTGTIDAIDTRIDTASRSFKVRGFIKNADRALPAGMFMHVSIAVEENETLVVPEEALMIDEGQPFVFRLNPAKEPDLFRIDKREVTIGRRGFGYVELTDGIAPGDEVVTRGIQKIRPGAMVKKRDLATAGSPDSANSADSDS
jgi:membrane fusion protein (multidrug efflux system)